MESVRAQVAVLSVMGGSATGATGMAMENVVANALTKTGHQIASFESVKNSETAIRAQLVGWIEDPDIDLVIVIGEGFNISKALAPLVDQPLPGFADLLRMLAFQEIGASAMLSTAEAARCANSTFVFVLPVGEAAVRAAMEKLILPQLDPNTQPKNLISEMPRFKEEGDFTRVDNAPAAAEAVPMAIVKERTVSGAGLVPRLPAQSADPIPEPARKRPPTQTRVKSPTSKNVLVRKVEDPTKPIELQKLERQIELSKVNDSTKPMDLSRRDEPPELNEETLRANVSPVSANEAVTKIAPAPERPAGPIGRVNPTPSAPVKIPRATPALATPVTAARPAKKPAIIVEEQLPARPRSKTAPRHTPSSPPAKVTKIAEQIEPIHDDELETVEREGTPPPHAEPKTSLPGSGGQVSSPAHALSASDLEPVDTDQRATLERLLPPEPKRPEPVPPSKPSRPPTAPPMPKPVAAPLPASSDLPAGSFEYTGLKKSKLPLVLLLLVVIASLAVVSIVVFTGRGGIDAVKDSAVVAGNDPPVPDASEPPPAIDAAEEIEMEPVDAGTKPAKPTNKPPRGNDTRPKPGYDGKPIVSPNETKPDPKPDTKPDPKPDTKPEPKDDGCDESACVIEKYASPCCAKYKPTGDSFTPSGDSLERPQIKAGMERVRPAISRCGEQHTAKGTVKVAVSVNPDGVVTGADVVAAPDPELGKCVAGFVRKATFAKTANGGSFSYPFVF